MSKAKIKKLEGMIGKSWADKGGNEFNFLSLNVDGDICTIATDSKWQKTDIYDIDVFVEKYTPIDSKSITTILPPKDNSPASPATHLQSSVIPNATMSSLAKTIIENIEKVKKDKDYIPQAKNMSDSVNTLIGLAKIEIDLRTKM